MLQCQNEPSLRLGQERQPSSEDVPILVPRNLRSTTASTTRTPSQCQDLDGRPSMLYIQVLPRSRGVEPNGRCVLHSNRHHRVGRCESDLEAGSVVVIVS